MNGKSDQDYTENTYNATDFFGERGEASNFERNSEELAQQESDQRVEEESVTDVKRREDYVDWESSEAILSEESDN